MAKKIDLSIDFQTFVHQRSWWKIVSITVKIANINYIICTYLTVTHFKRLCGLKSQRSSCYSPMPKFLGLFSNRGFTTFLASCFLATEGAGATFFPLAFFPLGYGDTTLLNLSPQWAESSTNSILQLLLRLKDEFYTMFRWRNSNHHCKSKKKTTNGQNTPTYVVTCVLAT